MACVCGGEVEEHENETGPCNGDHDPECECLGYEEEDEEEDEEYD
jgi:hypothetical protein